MTIILKLSGGLGNQIFQYSAARALAIHHQVPLKIDLDWFDNTPTGSTPRQEMLSLLNINPQFIHSKGLPLDLPEMKISFVYQLLRKLTGKKMIYREKRPFIFQKKFFTQEPPLYIEGYWQSHSYISSIREIILQEITPNFPLHSQTVHYLNQINACPNSIMLHIRRGDYVSLATANQFHGVLSLNYYANALSHLKELQNAQVFVFSDDIEWAKNHLTSPIPTNFIEGIPNSTAVVEELYLMKHCQHHIIANSSLSWLGAWLCEKQGQQVFAPKKWLANESFPMNDLIPPTWVLME
jgi:hypothetical protein